MYARRLAFPSLIALLLCIAGCPVPDGTDTGADPTPSPPGDTDGAPAGDGGDTGGGGSGAVGIGKLSGIVDDGDTSGGGSADGGGMGDGGGTGGGGTQDGTGGGGTGDGVDDGGAGDTGGNGDTVDDPSATTFAGVLDCETRESIGDGAPGSPMNRTKQVSITFDTRGFPVQLLIPGYESTPDQWVSVRHTGDTELIEQDVVISGSIRSITMGVTVTQAIYGADFAQIDLAITYFATQGQVTLEGTGTQAIDIRLSGDLDGLSYDSTTAYSVEMRTGTIRIPTHSTTTCSGTLIRQ